MKHGFQAFDSDMHVYDAADLNVEDAIPRRAADAFVFMSHLTAPHIILCRGHVNLSG